MKSPNKAGRSAAEEMEGRGLANGNPSQQNAPRTPSWAGAPSALERVRRAANEDGTMRFTALLRLHDPIPVVGQWLRSVVSGHTRYYGVPMNGPAIAQFRFRVGGLWHRALSRRSQTGRVRWARMLRLIAHWLPPARICHPYPLRRLGVIT